MFISVPDVQHHKTGVLHQWSDVQMSSDIESEKDKPFIAALPGHKVFFMPALVQSDQIAIQGAEQEPRQ